MPSMGLIYLFIFLVLLIEKTKPINIFNIVCHYMLYIVDSLDCYPIRIIRHACKQIPTQCEIWLWTLLKHRIKVEV